MPGRRRESLNKRKNILVTILVLLIVGVLGGCSKKKEEEVKTPYFFYYANKEETELVKVPFDPVATTTEGLVLEFIEQLKKEPQEGNLVRIQPDNVIVLEPKIQEKQLTLNFNEEYKQMDPVTEVLFRAGVVELFLQLPELEYVTFEVNGEPLREDLSDPHSEEVGRMTKEKFINNTSDNPNSYKHAVLSLYFANAEGNKLVKQEVPVTYFGNIPLEKEVLEQLIKGPKDNQGYATLSKDVKVLNVSVKEDICYVNLDKSFLDATVDVSEEVPIYSIVNSISDMLNVNKVQISIDGNTDVTYRDKIHFDTYFERNLDIVEESSNDGLPIRSLEEVQPAPEESPGKDGEVIPNS